jgi:hypothetical protein
MEEVDTVYCCRSLLLFLNMTCELSCQYFACAVKKGGQDLFIHSCNERWVTFFSCLCLVSASNVGTSRATWHWVRAVTHARTVHERANSHFLSESACYFFPCISLSTTVGRVARNKVERAFGTYRLQWLCWIIWLCWINSAPSVLCTLPSPSIIIIIKFDVHISCGIPIDFSCRNKNTNTL